MSGYLCRTHPQHTRNRFAHVQDAPEGRGRPGGLLADGTGTRLFAIGSYVGEVVCRHAGGTWSSGESPGNWRRRWLRR